MAGTAYGAPRPVRRARAHSRGVWAVPRLLEELSRASGPTSSSSTICTGRSRLLLELLESRGRLGARDPHPSPSPSLSPDLLDERPHWGGGRANAGSSLLEPLGAPESELMLEGLGQFEHPGSGPGGGSSRRRRGTRSSSSSCSHMRARLPQVTARSRSRPPSRRCSPHASMPLEPQERETLERAAVVGQRFSLAAVAALLPAGPADRLPQLILALVRQGAPAPRSTPRVG